MPKKEKLEEAPEATNAPVSEVRSYFTKEIHEQVVAMSKSEMQSLLKNVVNDRIWIAMLKYTGMRTPLLEATLRGTDPVKEPSKMSWSQGAWAGLTDLEGYIAELNAPKQAPEPDGLEEGIPEPRTAGVIVG